MGIGKMIGLYMLGGGVVILLVYGLYGMLRTLLSATVDPIMFIAVIAIILGAVVLIASIIMERRNEELKNIKKEDLKP